MERTILTRPTGILGDVTLVRVALERMEEANTLLNHFLSCQDGGMNGLVIRAACTLRDTLTNLTDSSAAEILQDLVEDYREAL